MKTTLLLAASALAITSYAQVVRVTGQHADTDPYSRYYNSGQKITFTGRVTGIKSVDPNIGDRQVTLFVQNTDGRGTAVVDLGPEWFVRNQTAKIRVRDRVQVTGSKIIMNGKGIILASQVLVNGQGGPVLALRRPSGIPYWRGVEVAESSGAPTGGNVVDGTIQGFTDYTINDIPYSAAVLQTGNGLLTIDLGPQWYYGRQNLNYRVGDYISVVTGPGPIQGNPYTTIANTYSIYSGPTIYTLRYGNGVPVYRWNGR